MRPSGPALVEPDPVRRGTAVRASVTDPARPARRASRGSPRRSPRAARSGAPGGRRTSARASNTTSATASVSSSAAAFERASSSWWRTSALMPRAPHLQSYASAAPSRSTVTSYGMDLRPDAVEQDPPLAPDGVAADPAGEQLRGELLDERAADLAADLLAAVGDRERGLEDRLGAGRVAGRRRPPPIRTGSGTSPASRSGSVVSPFMTARASTRSAGVASASSAAARATSGSAWIPA